MSDSERLTRSCAQRFDRPEYASYVALCRELNMERHFEYGDFYEIRHEDGTARVFVQALAAEYSDRTNRAGSWPRITWLPTLTDWLELFESLDEPITDIEMVKFSGYALCAFNFHRSEEYKESQPWPTREEAAARVWLVIADLKSLDPATADDVVKGK